ncbi:hypothetical protein GGI20_001750 [Coemansia sp. BCRC 34301]|nr:hypothetical protein GGI20_001750 [Coemansia sp. BCRC 34301]
MALRFLALLPRAGPLPVLRSPTLVVTVATHQHRSIRLSAPGRSTAKDSSDHIEPLALACEKHAEWLDAENCGYSDVASVALHKGDKAMRAEAEAIIVNALKRNPPSTPGALLDRIAEGRAISSSSYLKEIVELMLVVNTGEWLGAQPDISFKPYLLNQEVCTQLILAIHQTGTQRADQRIGSRVLIELYNVSRARGWDISPTSLEHTAMYLANNSLYGVYRAVRHVSHWSRIRTTDNTSLMLPLWRNPLSELEIFEISLGMLWDQARAVLSPKHMGSLESYLQDDPLDAAMDIARLLDDRQHRLSSAFATCLLRSLCARERRSDAEWLFARSRDRLDWKHFGNQTSLMMTLYYRLGDASAAGAAFAYFRDLWKQHWNTISTSMVMPDETSLRAENWRQIHEENAEPDHKLYINALRKLRCCAAAPFYRFALELVGSARIDEAMQLLDDSRHKDLVTIDSAQLSILVSAMLAHGFVNQAYATHIEFRRSQNTDSEEAVVASSILFGEATHSIALTSLVAELGKLDDWDRIWCAIGDGLDHLPVYPRADSIRALLERALVTGNAYHAIRCAQLIRYIGIRDKKTVLETPDSWIEHTLAGALNLDVSSGPSQSRPFVDLTAALLFTDVSVSDHVYARWNAAVIGQALAVLSCSFDADLTDMHSKLYQVIGQSALTGSSDVCAVLQSAAIGVLDTIPESLQSVPSLGTGGVSQGWAGFLPADTFERDSLASISVEKGVDLSPGSAFWECTVRALARPTDIVEPRVAARYLLLTLKLAYVGKARVSPIAIAAANMVLNANECPTVDLYTCELQDREQFKTVEETLHSPTTLPGLGANPIMIQLSKQQPLGGEKLATNPPIPVCVSSSLDDKLRWYNSCRQSRTIPMLTPLVWLVKGLIRTDERSFWEQIVDQDMPLYLAVLGSFGKTGQVLQRQYAQKVWSVVAYQYARLQKLEEAVEYYRRIVEAGAYPSSFANAEVLAVLVSSSSAPLPVLPQDQSDQADKIYGMSPAYPPHAESPAERFLVAANSTQRADLVAKIGLSMLYSMLRRKMWPTVYFFSVLLKALGKARKVTMLRRIFEVVMPNALRALPLGLRTKPNLILLPDVWTVAISEAIRCGHLELAKLWFTEYRMSAMPMFREEGSPYSRIICQGLPSHIRLLRLGSPYYLIPQLGRRPLGHGVFPSPWYDLEQVEMQLEMDRLRAMDKLPLAYFEAAKMLNIYTTVAEHNNMAAAESLAAEILALNSDTRVPSRYRPSGNLDLAYCWKLMISGYIYLLNQQQMLTNADDMAMAKTKERLGHWFKMWSTATGQYKIAPGDSRHKAAMLLPEQVEFIRSAIRRARGK